MRVFLTSKAFSNETINSKLKKELGELDFVKAKVLYLPTAVDERIYTTDKYFGEMIQFGFQEKNIIKFDYKNAKAYEGLEIDVIYVSGGNTFLLLDRIQKCKFDKELKKYIKNGAVYIGRSAGSHLVTQNVEHILNFDEVGEYIGDYEGLAIWDGILICHYNEDRKQIYDEEKAKGHKIERLTDEEMLVVNEKSYYKV